MTLDEFGSHVKQSPEVLRFYSPQELAPVPNNVLALKVLRAYPQYWDLISPVAGRLYELSRESTTVDYGGWLKQLFFGGPGTIAEQMEERTVIVQAIAAEAEMLHRVEVLYEASTTGVPADAMPEIAVIKAQASATTESQKALLEVQHQHRVAEAEKLHQLKLAEMDHQQQLQIALMKAEAEHIVERARMEDEIEERRRQTEVNRASNQRSVSSSRRRKAKREVEQEEADVS